MPAGGESRAAQVEGNVMVSGDGKHQQHRRR